MENTSTTTVASPPLSCRAFTSPPCISNHSLRDDAHHDLCLRVSDASSFRRHTPHPSTVCIIAPAVSHDLTCMRPPLRKKPKLTATPTTTANSGDSLQNSDVSRSGMLKPVGLQKTTSVPSFNLHPLDYDDPNDCRPSTSSAAQPAIALHRIHSSSNHRSLSQKRPPASHSSYPVETICGPPPSYSTQQTRSQDKIRAVDRQLGPQPTSITTRDTPSHNINEQPHEPKKYLAQSSLVTRVPIASSSAESVSDEINTQDTSDRDTPITPDDLGSLVGATERSTMAESFVSAEQDLSEQRLKPSPIDEDSKGSSSDERKSEDLFLNIAKTDASRSSQVHSNIDKRRSRISLPFFSNARPTTGYKSSPIQDRFDTSSLSGRSEALKYYSKRASLGQHVPGALSRAYTEDTLRPDSLASPQDTRGIQDGDLSRRTLSRRYSNANTSVTGEPFSRHLQRPSTARNSRLVSDSGFLDRSKVPDHNATESTISTTAPSTVWDELDDLKSRIRKLELTGKLPPSSAAAMTTSERPKTATTAATTLSSSPKPKPGAAPLQSAIEGIPSNVHPTLHEALGKAKSALSSELYQKLQATAQDALQLSIMMTPEGYTGTGSTIGASAVSERQVRRRTESMCRSLTELAIAILAENKQAPTPGTRPSSRDTYAPSSLGLRSRRYSNEPNDRPPVSARVQSRLESRRTSIPLGATLSPQGATPEHTYQTPPTALPQVPATSSSRLGSTSNSLRSRRTPGQTDGITADEEASPSVRPVSRAMTEVSTYRNLARDRAAYSREYTAQHPMPQHARPRSRETSNPMRSAMPSNVSSSLISRRKHASPASLVGTPDGNPTTPKDQWGRITIVPAAMSSPIEVTPESQVTLRPSNSRRSLGFASRISSVSSRLRAAKAERSASIRETPDSEALRNIAPSGPELDNMALERHNSGHSVGLG
ncbi:hypothetical protein PV08_06060 [Exophiala spinifera]|uniref:LPXTG-motif cell wall anchor domain protein n=1 Tax=Exophiala spinifera TaxID=91928 RepID=A0A0D2BXN1_9EURO|nr:uncharacterized protein PV08_06060 [Exophiala spinifera]KIW16009.1 hypothetical protein PV08_06060 [Exophiala spinifera]